MLLNHFNLRDQPFGVTPDPRYLFLTNTHREALEGLLYGINSGLGFIALTAEPGMGKTTLLRETLNRLGDTARTVFIFQAITDATELFRALLIDLGEKDLPVGTLIDLEMRLNEILLKHNESGQRLVVILDEAQNLDDSVLEAIRMLSNFETARDKLLQVILSGQHQLADRLATPELVQLRQRISIFATLKPLTRLETAAYIEHRLKVAGYENPSPLFTPEAVSLIAHYAGGVPRNINNICFNSLSTAYALGKNVMDAEIVRAAIADLGLEGSRFGEPTVDQGSQRSRFAEPTEDPASEQSRFAEPIDEPVLQQSRFAESTDELSSQGSRFTESPDEPSSQGSRFTESPDEPSSQGSRFAESTDDPVTQEPRFAESSEDPGSQRSRFSEPIMLFEPDEDESEESDFSEERETSPGLRIALIAALLFATALSGLAWYVVHSGAPASSLMSQVTSWFQHSPPTKDQPQVQAPPSPQPATPQTPASPQPALPQVDQSAQTSLTQKVEPPAQAAIPSPATSSQGDSSLQSAIPSEAKPTKRATEQASQLFGVSKPNRERPGTKTRPSRITVPNRGVEAVGARRGQSFAGICVERYNGCTPALLNTIVELNPGIKDHDHLEAGQRVFLPVIESRPQRSN